MPIALSFKWLVNFPTGTSARWRTIAPGFNSLARSMMRRYVLAVAWCASSITTTLIGGKTVDECQDWANKAEALASYAKMADDDALRKLADRIQARAARSVRS